MTNDEGREDRRPRIVVGVDDSDGARLALQWAFEEAKLRSAGLEVVNAWVPPWTFGHNPNWFDDAEWFSAQSIRLADKLVQELPDRHRVSICSVEVKAANPAEGLIDVADGAALLVVGTRGLGGFGGLLLGSTATQCTRHASCPVVVVPTPQPPAP